MFSASVSNNYYLCKNSIKNQDLLTSSGINMSKARNTLSAQAK